MYEFETESIEEFIEENDAEKIAVQLPTGLRPMIGEVRNLFDEDQEVFFLNDSCYGACDLGDDVASKIGCDVLIHFGHADMGLPTSVPTLYVEARIEEDPTKVLKEAVPELAGSTWGLTATVQHVHVLEDVKQFLREEGIDSVVGDPGPRSKHPGQVLGCDWGSAKSVEDEVDGFLYVGTGRFHPLGIFLATQKPVFLINPVSGTYEKLDFSMKDFLKKRIAAVEKARSGERIGLLVSTKRGQERLSVAEGLAGRLEEQGYEPYVLVGDELDFRGLDDYRLDAFVNTACPRISLDDSDLFEVPVLTPFEAEVMLGDEDWEPYRLDEIGINF